MWECVYNLNFLFTLFTQLWNTINTFKERLSSIILIWAPCPTPLYEKRASCPTWVWLCREANTFAFRCDLTTRDMHYRSLSQPYTWKTTLSRRPRSQLLMWLQPLVIGLHEELLAFLFCWISAALDKKGDDEDSGADPSDKGTVKDLIFCRYKYFKFSVFSFFYTAYVVPQPKAASWE